MSSFTEDEMYVTKRNGISEIVSFDKILKRIKNVGQQVNIKINYTTLAMKVIDQLYSGISTTKIDELTSEQCASMSSIHPDYNILAGRITISNHHKNTNNSFVDVMQSLYNYKDIHGNHCPMVTEEFINNVLKYGNELEQMCDYSRDYLIEYFGFKTLERAYLMKINKKVVERPQHLWLRVSIGIHGNNLDKIRETYELMSNKYFTHATPTLFNAGTLHPQLSSCYLLAMESDSINGIYNTLKDCALISKWAGGIGLHIHNIRAAGSHIRGTNGSSNGIVPMLKVFNNTAKYVDQCVHPKSIIYTTDGPIQIQDCIPGVTNVFNRSGNTETIHKVLEHTYTGEILRIKLYDINDTENRDLIITPEHPIYAIENVFSSIVHADLTSGFSKMNWICAKDLVPNDWIAFSIPNHIIDYSELTEDVCYIYGIILSGIILHNPDEQLYMNKITVSASPKNIKIIEEYLNMNCVEYHIKETLNSMYKETIDSMFNNIEWNQTVNLPFCKSDFIGSNGKYNIGKRWLFLPDNKIQRILDGIGLSYSSELAKFISFFKLRLCVCSPNIIKFNDNILIKIKSINKEIYSGILYDLQMKNEHNYLLQYGLVHNGGGKRNGSFAIYLEPWHADIEIFLQMRKNHGDEELKARDLFYALWIPDLFMERVKNGLDWTLMCPDECPGLADVHSADFVQLYESYEKSGKGRKTIKARDLWFQILDAQMETGTPYLLYKDSANRKSNQQNVGTIKSSNLCSEIIEYSDENETAVCNLASIALPSFIDTSNPNEPYFDYVKLHSVVKVITYNLNRIIDINFYPTEKTRRSNLRHRPIGIGVQGLADVFMMLNLPFTDDKSKTINKNIFETIYHAALTQSYEMALTDGPYETFFGSPASKGELQFDLWNINPTNTRYDWDLLKSFIQTHGLRNSLLLAPMPTASTSQILGFNECIEPITSNIYNRRTIAGEFILANKYLMNDLLNLGLWNEKIKNNIIANHGSIQHIDTIPVSIREKYKTVWELPMKQLIDMAADRGAFICQSQSLNLWIEDPNYNTLTSMHFYSWSKGLKTGIYYLRRRGRHQAQQFTIEPEKPDNIVGQLYEETEDEICEMCSS
jgi:ribonucleoside-diphosphate reductase alpha subunit